MEINSNIESDVPTNLTQTDKNLSFQPYTIKPLNTQQYSTIELTNQNQKILIDVTNENQKLKRKLMLMSECLEVFKQKSKIKSQQIANYQELSLKKSQHLKTLKSTLAKCKQKQQYIYARIKDIYKKIEQKKQKIAQDQQCQKAQLLQIKQMAVSLKQLLEQKSYAQQVVSNNLQKKEQLKKLKLVQKQLMQKQQLVINSINQFQQRNVFTKQSNQEFIKKINNLTKIINCNSHKNNILREKLKTISNQNKFMSVKKINQILIDQKKQIKSLDLKVGKLNQELLYANQKLSSLNSSLIYKTKQINKIKNKVKQYKNQIQKIQKQTQFIRQAQIQNHTTNYLKQNIDSKSILQKRKTYRSPRPQDQPQNLIKFIKKNDHIVIHENKAEDPKTQIKKTKQYYNYRIIQSDSQLKSEQMNQKNRKRSNGSLKSVRQEQKKVIIHNEFDYQTHLKMKALIGRYEKLKTKNNSKYQQI